MNTTLKVSDPIITVRPPIAALLSILQGVDGWEKWLFCNYSLLYASTGPDFIGVDIAGNSHLRNQREWHFCPYIKEYLYPSSWASLKFDNVCNMIVDLINDDQYVFFTINEKYIEMYRQNDDLKHELFIFGYDSDDRYFLCRDFWDDRYKTAKIPFDQVQSSFENYSGYDDAVGGIAGWKLRSEKVGVLNRRNDRFNVSMLRNNFLRYLYPQLAFDRDVEQTHTCYWGIDSYNGIRKIIESKKFLSLTDAYAFWAHKYIIVKSVQYCFESCDRVRTVEKYFIEILNLARQFLLYNMKQCKKHNQGVSIRSDSRIMELLNKIEVLEKKSHA